jgi:hypothetical protein
MEMGLAQALLTLVLNRTPATTQVMQFAGIVWGDTPAAVDTKLRAGGFTPADKDGEDIGFRGSFAGYEGTGWVYFAKGKAVKTIFVIRPAAEQVLPTYDRVRSWLTRQYGKTTHQMETYDAPYAKGDGRALEALREGKSFIGTAWREGPDTGPLDASSPGVILRAGKDLAVRLSYEGPGWSDEVKRRQGR